MRCMGLTPLLLPLRARKRCRWKHLRMSPFIIWWKILSYQRCASSEMDCFDAENIAKNCSEYFLLIGYPTADPFSPRFNGCNDQYKVLLPVWHLYWLTSQRDFRTNADINMGKRECDKTCELWIPLYSSGMIHFPMNLSWNTESLEDQIIGKYVKIRDSPKRWWSGARKTHKDNLQLSLAHESNTQI
jgi:hypothetical protein